MILNVPIEPIPMRYSVDWNEWFREEFTKRGTDYYTIQGKELTKGIEQGRFLDCVGTNYYKSSQLMEILHAIQNNLVKNGDVIFFHDLWFPGIEQIKYTLDALQMNVKIMGMLHAGAYDPNDFLYQRNMGKWAVHFEHMLFALTDKIFVATHFHKRLIIKSRSLDPDKIIVTGFPFKQRKFTPVKKKNQIVFPHRNDSEKNPLQFRRLKASMKESDMPGWEWATTYQLNDKDQYYKTLEKSKIAISFSDQETWGIAMQECVIAGCIPLVPYKLSYKEMFLSDFMYDSVLDVRDTLIEMVIQLGFEENKYEELLPAQKDHFVDAGIQSFTNIISELEN